MSFGDEKKHSKIQKDQISAGQLHKDSRTRLFWYRDDGFPQITVTPTKQRQSCKHYRPRGCQLRRCPQVRCPVTHMLLAKQRKQLDFYGDDVSPLHLSVHSAFPRAQCVGPLTVNESKRAISPKQRAKPSAVCHLVFLIHLFLVQSEQE